MDELLDFNNFPILHSPQVEDKLQSLRLLSVFGNKGQNVFLATNEDIVCVFGDNHNACLGLGHWVRDVTVLQVNPYLSHHNVVDIAFGYQHVLALTASGQIWSWGQNNFGELGISSANGCPFPKPIAALVDQTVVQISCGSSYSLALTADGSVYGWGRNTHNQLGLGPTGSVWLPTRIPIKDEISAISSGRIHSLALTASGQVYCWGIIRNGSQGDIPANPNADKMGAPSLLKCFEGMQVSKVVSGPGHSLFLTTDCRLYGFGNNYAGQVGNGMFGVQKKPTRIGANIMFKDVIASTAGSLSVGISKDNQYFVWGFVNDNKVFSPKRVNDPSLWSVIDVFAVCSLYRVTFKTVVVNHPINETIDLNSINESVDELNPINKSKQRVSSPKNGFIDYNIKCDNQKNSTEEVSPTPTKSDSENQSFVISDNNHSVLTSEPLSEKVFINYLSKSFNNPNNCDLRFRIDNKLICCHKNFLQFRNEKFYRKCTEKFKNEDRDEIRIKAHLYEPFLAFIGYLYVQTPEITEDNCVQLFRLAHCYDEPELKELCQQFISSRLDVSNVCHIFENAVNTESKELEKSCVDLVSKNISQVFNSEAFLSMDALISMRMIRSINLVNH